MKSFFVLSITLLFALVAGCNGGDGDGGDTTADTDTATDEPTEPAEPTPTTITLCSGTKTVLADSVGPLCSFSIFETGTLEGRAQWTGPPDTMVIAIIPMFGSFMGGAAQGSPAVATYEMTDDRLSMTNDWFLVVDNNNEVDVEVEYRVRFTPD